MWKVKLLCLVLVLGVMNTDAVNRYRRYRKRQAGGYASAGGYAGAGSYAGAGGYGGGYTGGYNGGYADDYGTGSFAGNGFDYAPGYGGFIDPYLFHQQLTAQILAQQAAQTNAIISTLTSGNAQVSGTASMLPDNVEMPDSIQSRDNAQIPDNNPMPDNNQLPDDTAIQQQFGNNAYYGNKPHRYAPNYAAASGSVGPGGYYQTAYISPANSGVPNIVNRFSPASTPGGYKGVSVSSFSSSSDVNGRRTSNRGAQTTINDNGKVTTYGVHS